MLVDFAIHLSSENRIV